MALAREYVPPTDPGRDALDGAAPACLLFDRVGRAVDMEAREPLVCEAEHFVQALLDRAPIRSDGQSGRRVVAALEAGQRSLGRGGRAEPVED